MCNNDATTIGESGYIVSDGTEYNAATDMPPMYESEKTIAIADKFGVVATKWFTIVSAIGKRVVNETELRVDGMRISVRGSTVSFTLDRMLSHPPLTYCLAQGRLFCGTWNLDSCIDGKNIVMMLYLAEKYLRQIEDAV